LTNDLSRNIVEPRSGGSLGDVGSDQKNVRGCDEAHSRRLSPRRRWSDHIQASRQEGRTVRTLLHLSIAAFALAATAVAAYACEEPHAAGPMTQAAFEARLTAMKLPPLAGLTAQSDVADGVPEDIQRAAYRRAYELMSPVWAAERIEDYPTI
jgi:hypothetical protein